MKDASPSKGTSVWLIEDHDDFRNLVAWQINQFEGMHCPQHFSTCEQALTALERDPKPEVILCDIGLPGMDGIEGIRKIKALSAQTHVIVLTVYDDHDKVFNALCAGASGYLLKNAAEENLAVAIHDVLHGGAPMNPRVAKRVLDMFAREHRVPQPPDYGLSAREKAVLELMVKGMTKKEIAGQLGVSFHTVNNQLRNVYEKLHVHNSGMAIAKALREKLF